MLLNNINNNNEVSVIIIMCLPPPGSPGAPARKCCVVIKNLALGSDSAGCDLPLRHPAPLDSGSYLSSLLPSLLICKMGYYVRLSRRVVWSMYTLVPSQRCLLFCTV